MTEGLSSWVGRWARQQARAGSAGRSRRACRARGRLGGRRAWARGQAQQALGRGRASGRRAGERGRRQRHAGRAARTRQARGLGAGRAAWALGARPGRVGWAWAVHSVHSAYFRSVLTRFFFLSH